MLEVQHTPRLPYSRLGDEYDNQKKYNGKIIFRGLVDDMTVRKLGQIQRLNRERIVENGSKKEKLLKGKRGNTGAYSAAHYLSRYFGGHGLVCASCLQVCAAGYSPG